MGMAPYYGPVGASSQEIFIEKNFLMNEYLTGLTYGIQLVLYIACMRILYNVNNSNRFTYFLQFYITLLCGINTVWMVNSAVGLQNTFIDNRNYPGGVIQFVEHSEVTWPSHVASYILTIIGNVLADALLLWRCRVIWFASLGPIGDYFMIFPMMMFLASFATGVAFAVAVTSPHSVFGASIVFVISFVALSVSLNVILSIMIAGRIWSYQRRVRRAIGSDFGKQFTSISTIFVESAAMYSIVALLLGITAAIHNPTYLIWLAITPSVQLISSYLIIYRVADGRAWTTDTLKKIDIESSIAFHRRAPSTVSGNGVPLPIAQEKADQTPEAFQTVDTIQFEPPDPVA